MDKYTSSAPFELPVIRYVRNTRRKKLAIKVLPFVGVIVEVPPRVTKKMAEDFVAQHRAWIISAIERAKSRENRFSTITEKTIYKTRFREIRFAKHDNENFGWQTGEKTGLITIPSDENFESKEVQDIIRKILAEIFRDEAKFYLPKRLNELANLHGFKYNTIFIKNLRSKWGSCSGKNNINLNLHLMRLPNELIDYVILHELTHTLEKNHSSTFWNKLEKVCPGSRTLDKNLKKYSVEIY